MQYPRIAPVILAVLLVACDTVESPVGPSLPDITRPPELRAIAHGNGRFVAVGKRETWINHGMSQTWKHAGDTAVAVWSDDGVSWNAIQLPEERGWLRDVEYGNGAFLVLGGTGHWIQGNGYTLRSVDGVQWTRHASPLGLLCNWLTHENGAFLASCMEGEGASAYAVFARSADGISWERVGAPMEYNSAVNSGGGVFVGYNTSISWSQDGKQWTTLPKLLPARDDKGNFIVQAILNIAFTGTEFIGSALSYVHYGGEMTGPVIRYTLRSTNGQSWTLVPQSTASHIMSHAFGNNVYVGTADGIYTAATLGAWQRTESGDYSDVIFADEVFVAVGKTAIATSQDGTNWTKALIPLP